MQGESARLSRVRGSGGRPAGGTLPAGAAGTTWHADAKDDRRRSEGRPAHADREAGSPSSFECPPHDRSSRSEGPSDLSRPIVVCSGYCSMGEKVPQDRDARPRRQERMRSGGRRVRLAAMAGERVSGLLVRPGQRSFRGDSPGPERPATGTAPGEQLQAGRASAPRHPP